MYRKPIRNSYQLWKNLKANAGLDVTSTDGYNTGYDDAILDELRLALFPGNTEPFETLLSKDHERISTTDLLVAFLSTMKPISLMQREILEMLRVAGGTQGEDSLQIEFDFSGNNPLKLLLKEFAMQQEIIEKTVRQLPARRWNIDELWLLIQMQSDLNRSYENEKPITSGLAALMGWIKAFEKTRKFQKLPFMDLKTNEEKLNERISIIVSVLNEILSSCLQHAPNHDGLREVVSVSNEKEERFVEQGGISDWPARQLWYLASDFWQLSAARWIYSVLTRFHLGKLDLESFCEQFDNATPPVSGFSTIESLTSKIEELLDLPVWKKRHEVYAVWVGTQMWKSLEDWNLVFHPVGDVLSFSFRGVHLATAFNEANSDILHWWTEKRTLASGLPSGRRTKAIQPDYRVQRSPLSSEDTDALILEVKQYKRSSRKNFADAINDYAHACPSAGVLLVNYGPISTSVSRAISPKFCPRTKTFQAIRPDSRENCLILQKTISGILDTRNPEFVYYTGQNLNLGPLNQKRFHIRLDWGTRPADLDLHVVVRNAPSVSEARVYYDNSRLQEWVKLSQDIRNGFGPEIADICMPSGILSVFVHQFSDDGIIGDADPKITIQLEEDVKELEICFSAEGKLRYWYACDINVLTGVVTEHNKLSDSIPSQ